MKAGLDGLLRLEGGVLRPNRSVLRCWVPCLSLVRMKRNLHAGIGRYAVEGDVDALLTVGSASDASLDALAGAWLKVIRCGMCFPY